MDSILLALQSVFSPVSLLVNILGVALGIVFGALPGLNGVVGVALLLPLTYGLEPAEGLIMLAGMYMGATYGGSISAILLNVPGTGEAACTALNGNLLAKHGRGKEALTHSVIASTIGGVFGCIVLLFFTPTLSQWALKFGYPEMFLISLAGLTVVGSLMGKSVSKGFFSVSVGLFLAMMGMDKISSNYRFTFDNMHLQSGISLVTACVGFFAVAEMLSNLSMGGKGETIKAVKKYRAIDSLKACLHHWKLVLKCSIIGTIIGILPGTGGAIASYIAYGEAKRTTKDPENFGQNEGCAEGILAPEAANNAAVGGSFVPLLVLGIPGSATSAIIYGALTVHGLIPGPQLFNNNVVIVYALMLGLLLSVILMAVAGLSCGNIFSKVLAVDMKYIVPAVMAFSAIGAYSARNNVFDILLAIVLGVVGLFFQKAGIPIAPCILGIVLGTMAEANLRRAMTVAVAKEINLFFYIVSRPISVVVILLVILLIYTNMKSALRAKNAE